MSEDIKYFQNVMAEISDANESHGVPVRGGRKYLEVAKRVEIFRKHYGVSMSITTEPLEMGIAKGEPVIIRATISHKLMAIATGTACEVIGDGNVNRSSAVENAETSAIGRALACLGLHGGEFASLNEMERIGDKPENLSAAALMDAWEQGIFDALPEDPSESVVAEKYAETMSAEVQNYKSARGVEGYMKKHAKHLDFIKDHAEELYGPLRADAWARMQELSKGKAA